MGCCESKVQDVNHEAIKKVQRHDLNNYSRNNKLELQKDLNKQHPVKQNPKEDPKRNIFDDEDKRISKEHELNNLNKNNRLELQQDSNKPMVEKQIIVSEEELIERQELKEVEEWKNLIETLLANKKLMAYALAKKNTDFKLVKEVGDYLAGCKEARTIAEKAWLAYVWVTHNINYDVDCYYNKDYRFCNPQSVLERGLAICGTYSEFYSIICNQIGVKCHVINGFAKGVGYQYGVKMNEGHAWNGIPNLGSNGRMRFIETTWGAGCVGDKKFVNSFSNQ